MSTDFEMPGSSKTLPVRSTGFRCQKDSGDQRNTSHLFCILVPTFLFIICTYLGIKRKTLAYDLLEVVMKKIVTIVIHIKQPLPNHLESLSHKSKDQICCILQTVKVAV